MWEAVASYSGYNVMDLRFIAHWNISNPFTNYIINHLLGPQLGQIKLFGQDTEGFSALLGTPNGRGVPWLLMQHKRQLGFKTIARAAVIGKRQEGTDGPSMVFMLRDMPSPPRDDATNTTTTAVDDFTGLCCSGNNSNTEILSDS